MTGNREQSTNTTGAGGTVAGGVSPTETRESRMAKKEKSFTKQQGSAAESSVPLATMWSRNRSVGTKKA